MCIKITTTIYLYSSIRVKHQLKKTLVLQDGVNFNSLTFILIIAVFTNAFHYRSVIIDCKEVIFSTDDIKTKLCITEMNNISYKAIFEWIGYPVTIVTYPLQYVGKFS